VKKELNLNNYTDREIVKAIMNLRAAKFLPVVQGLGAISQRMERRGRLVAKENSDEEVDEIIRRMFDDNSQEG
jgi:hypothetical protein